MCYHIMAAKLSIGVPIEDKKKRINMTQLVRNKRKRADKKSGKKKPRKLDYEVVPAPDSKLINNSTIMLSPDKSEITNLETSVIDNINEETFNLCLNSTPLKPILKTPTSKHKKKVNFIDDVHVNNVDNFAMSKNTSTPKREKLKAKKSLKFNQTKLNETVSICCVDKQWIKKFDLDYSDRDLLMEKGGWLNNNLINAALKILSNQFPNVKGLQSCDLIPVIETSKISGDMHINLLTLLMELRYILMAVTIGLLQ